MCQVVEKTRVSLFFFSIQLDESTDVAQCPQLLVRICNATIAHTIMYVQFCIHIYIIYSNMQTMNILQVYTRFVSDNHVEELLFCKPLTTTKAGGVMAMASSFFEEEELSWAQLVGVCMDRAPSMLGSKSGLCITLILRIPVVLFGGIIYLFAYFRICHTGEGEEPKCHHNSLPYP